MGLAVSGSIGAGTASPASKLETAGSFGVKTVTKSVSYTAADEVVILVSATGGTRTITLPLASSYPGRTYYIKKTDNSANNVTVQRSGSDNIDSGTSVNLATSYGCIQVVSDGSSHWYIIAQK